MALTFGGATTDRVDCASAAGIDDPTSVTVAGWYYPTTLTGDRIYFSKSRPPAGWRIYVDSTTSNPSFIWGRATQAQLYKPNDNRITINTWWFIAATSTGIGDSVHIYIGDLQTAATESTYGTTQNGSGAISSAAARSMFIGNIDKAAIADSFQGRIGPVGYWHNRVLTLAELQAWQFWPGYYHPEMKLYMHLGYNGTSTQVDWTGNGNNGTVTGATLADHVPLGSPFAGFDDEPYVVAAAAGHPAMRRFGMLPHVTQRLYGPQGLRIN